MVYGIITLLFLIAILGGLVIYLKMLIVKYNKILRLYDDAEKLRRINFKLIDTITSQNIEQGINLIMQSNNILNAWNKAIMPKN